MRVGSTLYALAGGAATALWAPWGVVQHLRGRTQADARLGWRRLPHRHGASLWVHAASVGEVNAVAPLVREWLRVIPGTTVLWTTQTMAGRARVLQIFPASLAHLAPFDACGAPGRVLRAMRPMALLIAETEIWPGWLDAASRAGVPVAFINARMSPRSAARYRWVAGVIEPALGQVSLVAAQSEADAARFVHAGAPPHTVVVTGNTKWDQPASLDGRGTAPLTAWLRRTDRHVVVAGSTRPNEEAIIAEAARVLRAGGERPLVVIAPRHLARLAAAESAVRRAWPGVRMERWSAAHGAAPDITLDVLLLDTHGELTAAYAAATVAFVGGTLAPWGGHNVGEPALSGVPVVFGPSTSQCDDMAHLLLVAGGALRVTDATALACAWQRWLGDPAARARAGAAAAAVVAAARGAAARTFGELQRRGLAREVPDA